MNNLVGYWKRWLQWAAPASGRRCVDRSDVQCAIRCLTEASDCISSSSPNVHTATSLSIFSFVLFFHSSFWLLFRNFEFLETSNLPQPFDVTMPGRLFMHDLRAFRRSESELWIPKNRGLPSPSRALLTSQSGELESGSFGTGDQNLQWPHTGRHPQTIEVATSSTMHRIAKFKPVAYGDYGLISRSLMISTKFAKLI